MELGELLELLHLLGAHSGLGRGGGRRRFLLLGLRGSGLGAGLGGVVGDPADHGGRCDGTTSKAHFDFSLSSWVLSRGYGLLEAGDGIRTRDPQLGKLMLYQLSYTRATAQPYRRESLFTSHLSPGRMGGSVGETPRTVKGSAFIRDTAEEG